MPSEAGSVRSRRAAPFGAACPRCWPDGTAEGWTKPASFYIIRPFKMAARSKQLSFDIRTHGGRRDGAGRKGVGERRNVPHRQRPAHDPRCPVHVTLRATGLCVSLRNDRVFPVVRDALRRSTREGLRVVEYSVQSNHLHLLVESDSAATLRSGLHGLTIRVARAINRALDRRGAVWSDRYHSRLLKTPREVRNALVYVLQNWRKHGAREHGVDPCSSASSFDGWRVQPRPSQTPLPLARACTWLARRGWRRLGLIHPRERPG
jgi:putative transposase